MSLSPVTLPLRFGVRAARSATSLALVLPQRALGLVVGLVRSRGGTSPSESHAAASQRPRPPASPRPQRSAAPSPVADGPAPGPIPAPVPEPESASSAQPISTAATADPVGLPADLTQESPTHITTETTLVESFAEPGAQDGAGAQVHVDRPWPGYEQLTAADVIDRLSSAAAGELTLVALYEGSHRNRRTVLAAADRELRTRN